MFSTFTFLALASTLVPILLIVLLMNPFPTSLAVIFKFSPADILAFLPVPTWVTILSLTKTSPLSQGFPTRTFPSITYFFLSFIGFLAFLWNSKPLMNSIFTSIGILRLIFFTFWAFILTFLLAKILDSLFSISFLATRVIFLFDFIFPASLV